MDIEWIIIYSDQTSASSMSNQSMIKCNDVHLPHGTAALCKAPPTKAQHLVAEQGTQRSCGVRPQQHADHTADTSAGPEGRQCGGLERLQAVGAHAEAQQNTHATSSERLHQQGGWPAQVVRPSTPPVVRKQKGTR